MAHLISARRLSIFFCTLSLAAVVLLPVTAGAQTFRVFHAFTNSEGVAPSGSLTRDSAGNFYGTAQIGGSSRYGTLFQIDPQGKLTVLHNFTGATDGGNPFGRLHRDHDGTLYGMTLYGGDPVCLCGIIYKFTAAGHFTVLHTFTGGTDGMQNIGQPNGGLFPFEGELYGITYFGGDTTSCDVGFGCGTIFKITRSGRETVLYSFTGGEDGSFPTGLVAGPSGTLYGVTESAYTGSIYGNIFQIDSSGNFSVLYDFTGASGNQAYYSPALAPDGSLIGTTSQGGAYACNLGLCGVVYRFDPATSTETVLHSFGGETGDGAEPGGSVLIEGSDVVGVTFFGGIVNGSCSFGCGVVYGITGDGEYHILHSFTGGMDGFAPIGTLTPDANGNLFGVATGGGANNDGIVFEITKE